ncbi:MAG: four helix bundle protein [Saprospiraceae bacterium]|jgi:four helix bundle protein|nr:four helix bundle protein [Saprospiraceae bacterium]
MATFYRFEDILAWQKARVLCQIIKPLTEREGFSRDFKLKDQILSSSGSVMDNIAEGYERQTNKQFVYFLFVSKGSCGEVRSQAYRALDFKYITQQEFEDIYARALEISKILHGLIQRLQPSDKNQ